MQLVERLVEINELMPSFSPKKPWSQGIYVLAQTLTGLHYEKGEGETELYTDVGQGWGTCLAPRAPLEPYYYLQGPGNYFD